jgi:hypothetical protein
VQSLEILLAANFAAFPKQESCQDLPPEFVTFFTLGFRRE